MTSHQTHRLETEALIEAIWGASAPVAVAPRSDPGDRVRQNAALATAMRAYLQQYLDESDEEGELQAPTVPT